jgi:integrase/recombinase XerD
MAGRPKGSSKIGLKYLNEIHLEKFFQAVDKSGDRRDQFLFRLILFLGLRVTEAVNLCLSDINFDGFQISIQAAKGGRNRIYDLDGKLWRRLKRWLQSRKSYNGHNGYLFPSTQLHDVPLSEQTAKMAFKRYAKQAGLNSDFSIHSLRHSCGIIHAKRGESAIQIMMWLRHRSVKSTECYFEQVAFEDQDRRAAEMFSQFL